MGGSGAFIYNEQTSKFDPFYVNQDETITAFITAITSDQKGQMWFGRMYGGLICADVENGKLTRYKHNDHNINSLISNKVTSLFTDHHGRIWIGTEDKGICYFDSSTNKFIRIEGFPQICVLKEIYGLVRKTDYIYIYQMKINSSITNKTIMINTR